MPKVLFQIKFTPYECPKNRDVAQHAAERAFYNGTAAYNYFDYTEKDGKVVKDKENEPHNNYMEKTSGVFNQDGILTAKQKAELAEKLKKTKSIIWHGFISFDDDTEKLFNTQKNCIDFIKGTMKTYFDENRMDMDKIELFCSLHSDTEHNHIHFAFFEKEPSTFTKGKPTLRKKGVFGKKAGERYELKDGTVVEKGTKGARKVNIYEDPGRDCFLYEANRYLEENKWSLHVERDILMSEMKALYPTELQKFQNRELRSSLKELARKLPASGRTGYWSENMTALRPEIDKVVKQFIDTVPSLRESYNAWNHAFSAKETEAKRLCAREGISYAPNVENRVINERGDLAKRLGNAVIKMAKAVRFDEFKEKAQLTNDLARKIAAKNNRRAVDRAILRAVKYGSHNGNNYAQGYDYSIALHKIEREIEIERQRQAAVYGA